MKANVVSRQGSRTSGSMTFEGFSNDRGRPRKPMSVTLLESHVFNDTYSSFLLSKTGLWDKGNVRCYSGCLTASGTCRAHWSRQARCRRVGAGGERRTLRLQGVAVRGEMARGSRSVQRRQRQAPARPDPSGVAPLRFSPDRLGWPCSVPGASCGPRA